LEYIASKVSDFEKLQKLSTEMYSFEYLKLKKLGEDLQKELDENEAKRKVLVLELNQDKLSKANSVTDHDKNITEIKSIENMLATLRGRKRMYRDYIEANMIYDYRIKEDQNISFLQDSFEHNLSIMDTTTNETREAMKEATENRDKTEEELKQFTEELSSVQEDYFKAKEEYEAINGALNSESLKQTGFKSENERKKYYEEEITKVVTEITTLERDLDIESQTKKKCEEYLTNLTQEIKEIKIDLEDNKDEEIKMKKDMDPTNRRQLNLMQIQKANFGLNERKLERDQNSRDMERVEEMIEAVDKSFKTVKRLIKKIDEVDVAGFHGLFIDLIDVLPRAAIPVDLALKNKMFVFVVDTVTAAEKIMKLNKEIKGGVISCFPLELIDQLNDSIPNLPNSNEIQPLLNSVSLRDSVDKRVEKLLNNFLGRTVMVNSLSTAFNVSEKFGVTSITPEMKIVNPGAFIAKTGYCDISKKRIENYRELMQLRGRQKDIEQSVFELETNIQNFHKSDLNILKEMQEFLVKQRKIAQNRKNYSLELMERNGKMSECQKNLERCSINILNLTKQIEVMKNSKDALMKDVKNGGKSDKKEDSSSLIQKLEAKKFEVIQLRMKMDGIKNKISLIENELQHIDQYNYEIQQREPTDDQEHRQRSSSTKSGNKTDGFKPFDQLFLEKKKRELIDLEEKITRLEEELQSLYQYDITCSEKRAEIDEKIVDKTCQLNKLNVERRNIHERMALEKLEDLKIKSDPDIIQSTDTNIKKLDELISNKTKKIKEIEKQGNQSHMYGFFLRMKEQFEEVKKKVDKLGDVKFKINDILEESERSKNVAIQNSLKKLAKKFNEYFSYFVKNAETSIKFIINSVEKKEEVLKNDEMKEEGPQTESLDFDSKGFKIGDHEYSGISVRVGFKDKNRMQSLKELSGGEKTVVAISLLFALNSLTASQIYLLDEVDSALDQSYREGLTSLLSKISSSGNTQLFITTFNQELIDSIDNIYKVDFRNLQSKIGPCTKSRALEVLKKIKEEKAANEAQ
jgi:structural maintenance of chromosome 3 (chondroitin sulfate proteoglycan 6)